MYGTAVIAALIRIDKVLNTSFGILLLTFKGLFCEIMSKLHGRVLQNYMRK